MTETSGSTYTFKHETLGDIKGRLMPQIFGTEVVHFRSIPYAEVPARFKQSVLLDKIPSDFDSRPHGDFTEYGAACPQVGGATDWWFDAYGGRLPDEVKIHFDDRTCLNLSIAVPKQFLDHKPENLFPVLVYVHGGGLSDGIGHVDGLHSTVNLAAFGVQEGTPVITVSIGYRLNWFGFLACQDLLEEDPHPNEDVFNVGLYDQRRAFLWIQKHIAAFGGDPDNITTFAESAGSVSLVYHMCSNVPLFKRAILQSGIPFGYSPTLEGKETMYQSLLRELQISGETAQERLEALRRVPAEKLISSASTVPANWMFLFADSKYTSDFFQRGIPSNANAYELVKTCPWVEDLIIGDDHFEGHVLMDRFKGSSPRKFVHSIHQTLPGNALQPMLEYYDIEPDMDKNLFWSNLTLFWGDVFLSEPMFTLADVIAEPANAINSPDNSVSFRRKKVFRYHFILTNPFPGTNCFSVPGHHFSEILFIFLTLLHRYPKKRDRFLERQALDTARKWITFAHGKAPWDEFVPVHKGGEGKIAICDDRCGWVSRTREEDERVSKDDPWGERRYRGYQLIREAFGELERKSTPTMDYANQARRALCNLSAWRSDENDDNS